MTDAEQLLDDIRKNKHGICDRPKGASGADQYHGMPGFYRAIDAYFSSRNYRTGTQRAQDILSEKKKSRMVDHPVKVAVDYQEAIIAMEEYADDYCREIEALKKRISELDAELKIALLQQYK